MPVRANTNLPSKADLNRSIGRFSTVWHVNLKVENGILHKVVSLVIERAISQGELDNTLMLLSTRNVM